MKMKFKRAKFIGRHEKFITGSTYYIYVNYDDYSNKYYVEEWQTGLSYVYKTWDEFEDNWIFYDDYCRVLTGNYVLECF